MHLGFSNSEGEYILGNERIDYLLDGRYASDFVAHLCCTTLSHDRIAVHNGACCTLHLCHINKN